MRLINEKSLECSLLKNFRIKLLRWFQTLVIVFYVWQIAEWNSALVPWKWKFYLLLVAFCFLLIKFCTLPIISCFFLHYFLFFSFCILHDFVFLRSLDILLISTIDDHALGTLYHDLLIRWYMFWNREMHLKRLQMCMNNVTDFCEKISDM